MRLHFVFDTLYIRLFMMFSFPVLHVSAFVDDNEFSDKLLKKIKSLITFDRKCLVDFWDFFGANIFRSFRG